MMFFSFVEVRELVSPVATYIARDVLCRNNCDAHYFAGRCERHAQERRAADPIVSGAQPAQKSEGVVMTSASGMKALADIRPNGGDGEADALCDGLCPRPLGSHDSCL